MPWAPPFHTPHTRTEERKDYDRQRGSASRRGYGRSWQKLRKLILSRDPICKSCHRAASIDVDHIVPKRDGGPDSMENLQGLCKPCHSTKTNEEGKGGAKSLPIQLP